MENIVKIQFTLYRCNLLNITIFFNPYYGLNELIENYMIIILIV